MAEHSKLVKMRIENIGCIGPEGLEIELNDILTMVGANNTGKSTVLKAYELATGSIGFSKEDRCIRSIDKPSSIEIEVHIPENTPNISEKWKYNERGLKLVKSRWECDENLNRIRRTWDPEINNYAADGKASGLDTVFNSRLPKPLRIGTLEEPSVEHEKLLKIILQPISDKLKQMIEHEDSDLKKALKSLSVFAKEPVDDEQEKINSIALELNKNQNEIFPNLSILFDIGIGEVDFNPIQLLSKNSKIKIKDWSDEIDWKRQGTGSQRALFWSILQVRSKLVTDSEIKTQKQKELQSLIKQSESLEKKLQTLQRADAIQKNKEQLEGVKSRIEKISSSNADEERDDSNSDISLPGYMLLIDEPEVGLHPSAIRAASHYLYSLAKDPSWQIMISTHSPLFVDPLQDHTTILRIERNDKNLTPRTYRSDKITFSDDEILNLKMLNKFDQALAEMFFGQLPIIIEGDTEYAAFECIMNTYREEFPPNKRPVLIRARGKDTIILIIKMLTNFKASFAVLHDADFKNKGVAWSANDRIFNSIKKARDSGCVVVHRVSIPTFEYCHLPLNKDKNGKIKIPSEKDKPWNFLEEMKKEENVESSVKKVFNELILRTSKEIPFEGTYIKELTKRVDKWININCAGDERFV